MKALSLILKIIETAVVGVWGAAAGILFPVFIMTLGEEVFPSAVVSETGLMVLWLVTAAIYILSAALIFGKHYRIAAVLSLAGLIGVLIMKVMFDAIPHADTGVSKTDSLYLPLIFVTICDLLLLAIEERGTIKKLLERNTDKEEEKAPSIFSDSDNDKNK